MKVKRNDGMGPFPKCREWGIDRIWVIFFRFFLCSLFPLLFFRYSAYLIGVGRGSALALVGE